MNTNFFSLIQQLEVTGDIHLIISKGENDDFVVSIMLKNEQCGDNAKNTIIPIILKGNVEELDGGFFGAITKPIHIASELMVNMEAFLKQAEEAQKQSAMEKEKSDKEKKEKESKDKKFKDAMQKAEALEGERKFKEAWTALPKASEFPEYVEVIRKKQDSYERHFAPSLFGEA